VKVEAKMKSKKFNLNRRKFIKDGIKGVAGALLLPEILNDKLHFKDFKKKDKYVYRTLGRTGIRLPVISIGGPENPTLIETALDRGILHINTSPEYRNGNQEIMIGKTLKDRPRDSFVIATGFAMWRRPQNQIKNYTKENIIESFEASLKRLNLDFVDIYYILGVSGRQTVLHSPFMEEMESFKKSGGTRFIGLTAHQNEPEVLLASIESKIYDVVLTAYNFRKIYRDEIKSAIAAAAKEGVGIVAMKTQDGYNNPLKAKQAIQHIDSSKIICADCSFCSVQCRMGFDVKERVLDIIRLQDTPDTILV
jgi:predicted aldo/keto reductase-like oxidoreductase